jgi:hypothetical protein
MENSISTPVLQTELCSYCNLKTETDDVFCANCGYPLKGTDLEQKNFVTQQSFNDIDQTDLNKKLKNAGMSLYYLAGIFVISGFINFFISKDDPEVLAIVIPIFILAVLFLILGAYSTKKPLACLISGLSLYIIVQILVAIDDPVNIARGIIFKIAIIGYLIKGIKSAIDIEKIKKDNHLA